MMKLMQNSVCVTNPCINLVVMPSVSKEYRPKVLVRFDLPQGMASC